MMKIMRLGILSFFTILIVGCASVPQQITEEQAATIKTVDVFVSHPAVALSYLKDDSTSRGGAAGFGLLGAVIGAAVDAGRNSNWKENSVYLIDEIQDLDYKVKYSTAIQSQLEDQGLLVKMHELSGELKDESKLAELLNSTASDADIIINYNYTVTVGFMMQSRGSAELFIKESVAKDAEKPKPDAQINFVNLRGIVDPSMKDVGDITADLIENDGAKLVRGIDQLNKETAVTIGGIFP